MRVLHTCAAVCVVVAVGVTSCRGRQGAEPRDIDIALARAAEAGDVAEVERLLKRGADPNRYDFRSLSALQWAAREGHLEVATVLVRGGAKVDEGVPNALCFAAMESQLNMADYLIDCGADPTRALSCAAQRGHLDMLKRLVARGGDLTLANDCAGVLRVAAQFGHAEVVEWLIGQGMDVEAADSYGYTPLCLAANSGSLSVVKILMRAGADVNVKTRDGYTPLSLAQRNGHLAVAEFLQASQ